MSRLGDETVDNPLSAGKATLLHAPAPRTRWIFCARVPDDADEQIETEFGMPTKTSGASKPPKSSRATVLPAGAPTVSIGQDQWFATQAPNADQSSGHMVQMSRSAAANDSMAYELRRVTARAQEDEGALKECRSQIREMERSLVVAQSEWKLAREENSRLSANLASQAGQLDAAKMRSVAARNAQTLMAKSLLENIDLVEGERTAEAALAAKLKIANDQIVEQQEKLEGLSVESRGLGAALTDATGQLATDSGIYEAKISVLQTEIAALTAGADRQSKLHAEVTQAAGQQMAAMSQERRLVQEQLTKRSQEQINLAHELLQTKMNLSVASEEVKGLKSQREKVQQELAAQLEEQRKDTAKLEKELATTLAGQTKAQMTADLREKNLVAAQRSTESAARTAAQKEKFEELVLSESIADKIGQIAAFKKQVASLKAELGTQLQLCSGLQAEVAQNESAAAATKKTNASARPLVST